MDLPVTVPARDLRRSTMPSSPTIVTEAPSSPAPPMSEREFVAALRGQLHSAYDAPLHGTLHGVPPPDQNSLEFELMVRHSIAYSPWAPTELPQLDFELSARPGQGIAVDSPSAA